MLPCPPLERESSFLYFENRNPALCQRESTRSRMCRDTDPLRTQQEEFPRRTMPACSRKVECGRLCNFRAPSPLAEAFNQQIKHRNKEEIQNRAHDHAAE